VCAPERQTERGRHLTQKMTYYSTEAYGHLPTGDSEDKILPLSSFVWCECCVCSWF